MRRILLLLLFSCTLTLSLSAQKRSIPKGKATPTKTQKQKTPKKKTPEPKNVPTTKAIQNLKLEQADLQKQINESQNLLSSTKKDVKSQLSNLAIIDGQITAQQTYVNNIQIEVDTLTHSIGVLSNELVKLEKELSECKSKYTHGVMYMYRNRLMQNKLMFIFAAKDFKQMYRRIRYAQEYTKYQRAQGAIVQKKEEAVNAKKAELERTNNEKQQLLSEGRTQQANLEEQKKKRQGIIAELNKKQKEIQSTLASQQKKKQQLDRRIDQLIQEEIRKAEQRRKAEEAKRKAEEAKRRAEEEAKKKKENGGGKKKKGGAETPTPEKPSQTPKYNAPDDADRKLSSNFAANQGRLPVPITGSYIISAHFGSYNPEGLDGVVLDNKGTDYTGKAGAQARCIFDGEVTYIMEMYGMKNILVRHGSYISVYCNLKSVSVSVGQKVTARQTLGTIATDAAGRATLHFQLRKETSKLNPERWIGR